jgi:molecular chaperone DnaK
VYDLGGGTFDVSIISVTKGEVSVIGTGGDPLLGGGDFDDRITGYVMQQIKEKFHADLSQDPNIWARVKREAEMRKRDLSNANATMLNLPYLTPQVSANIPLTRATFESLIADLLKKSLDCLDEAIDSAYNSNGIGREDIEQVLLVGGSTRVACIRKMIADHMGMDISDVRADINPDEVVSRGAAIVAANPKYRPSDGYEGKEIPIDMSKSSSEEANTATSAAATIVLNDVTSHTLGVMVNEGDFFPIIPKDSQIPARKEQDGFNNGGPATELDVMIFQGENPKALDNTLIGKLPIGPLEPRERGYYKFEVTFALDANGLLNVKVKSLKDGAEWTTQVQCNVRASAADIDKSAKELAEAMASDSKGTTESSGAVTQGAIPPPPRPAVPPPPRPVAPPPPQPVQPPVSTQSMSSASGATSGELSQPSADLPEKYQSTARRVFKFLSQLEPSNPNYRKLSKAYTAFLGAISSGDSDIDDYYEDMKDLYERSKFG